MSVEELLQAVNDGDESTAKRLVRGGVSPSDGCKRQVRAAHGIVRMFPVGTTGLHVAAYAAHTELLRFMLGHTKNLAPEDTNGATPLQIAMATGRASLNKITRVNSMESAKALVHGGSMMRLADWMGLHIERGSIDWEPDRTVTTCPGTNCGVTFGLRKRRHHCRGCGRVYCEHCAPVGGTMKERCCSYCRTITALWREQMGSSTGVTKDARVATR